MPSIDHSRRRTTIAQFQRLATRYTHMAPAIGFAIHKASMDPRWDGHTRMVKQWLICQRHEAQRHHMVDKFSRLGQRYPDMEPAIHDVLLALLEQPTWHGDKAVVVARLRWWTLSKARKRGRRRRLLDLRGAALACERRATHLGLNSRAEARDILRTIESTHSLTEAEWTVLELKLEGYSAAEIGRRTGQSAGAVRAMVSRARRRIRHIDR